MLTDHVFRIIKPCQEMARLIAANCWPLLGQELLC